ncbi:MAG: hypothetical protein NT130_00620 [Candidatus Micrarchaeota archaeon]|nr:hypothetical protein [Candidatus Micrarchaeota archaeon]
MVEKKKSLESPIVRAEYEFKSIRRGNYLEARLKIGPDITPKIAEKMKGILQETPVYIGGGCLDVCFEKLEDGKFHMLGVVAQRAPNGEYYDIHYAKVPEPYKTEVYEAAMESSHLDRESVVKDEKLIVAEEDKLLEKLPKPLA